MKKHDVHAFAEVRVKFTDVEAENHGDAVLRVADRISEFHELFATQNFKRLPAGVQDVEFADDLSSFLVDNVGDEDYSKSTWHASPDGMAAAPIIWEPLTAAEFRQHIDDEGCVRLAVPITLNELLEAGGINGLNDFIDEALYGNGVHGCLSDLEYRPVDVVDGSTIIIEVSADASSLELDGEAKQ